MDLRIIPASLLAAVALTSLGNPLTAQAAGQPAGQAGAPAATAAPQGKQDPDRATKTPAEQLADLQREKERLEKEIAFVRDRAAQSGPLLRDKFANRQFQPRAIDAGQSSTSSMVPTAATQLKRARLLTDAEAKANPDAMMVVDARPVTKAAVDALTTYLATFPTSGDENTRVQRATLELIKIESMLAALPDQAKEAKQQIDEAIAKLKGGTAFGEVAKTYSRGPGLLEDGKITVTHFGPFGLAVEAAAFATKEGALTSAIASLNGFVVLQVDKIVKGATPDADQIEAHLIQVPYHPDPKEMEQVRARTSIGKVDVAVREEKTYELLPAYLRPLQTLPPPVQTGPKGAPKAELPDDQPVKKAEPVKKGETPAPVKSGGI